MLTDSYDEGAAVEAENLRAAVVEADDPSLAPPPEDDGDDLEMVIPKPPWWWATALLRAHRAAGAGSARGEGCAESAA